MLYVTVNDVVSAIRCMLCALHIYVHAPLTVDALPSACHVELRCIQLFIAEVFVVWICCLRRVGGVPPLPTLVTQPSFFADVV
jgi:hypothetical protein